MSTDRVLHFLQLPSAYDKLSSLKTNDQCKVVVGDGDVKVIKADEALGHIDKCTYNPADSSIKTPHSRATRPTQPKILPNILYQIGNTPLVRINKITKSLGLECDVLAKCEYFNAGGSVKDRIGVRMIEDAEASGRLKPGDILIEPTSGNTGIGLALAAAVKGYRCIIVLPEKMSKEKVDVLKALGAEIIRTPSDAKSDSPESHIGVAKRLVRELPRAHILDQYHNASNPLAHYDGTAEEILEACDGQVDMLVSAAGTGGTITGLARKIKERCPNCKVIGVDPFGSVIAAPDTINKTDINYYEIEGIGYDFVPEVCDRNFVDQWYKSEDKPSFQMSRRMIREEGILCGGSSGSAMYCALKAAADYKLKAGQKVVVILADSIRNYMSKFLTDEWMSERNFIEQEKGVTDETAWWWYQPVSALKLKAALTVQPSATIQEALKVLSREGFDQATVVDEASRVTGMLTVAHVTSEVTQGKVKVTDTVDKVLYKQFKQVTADTSLGELSRLLNSNHCVIVRNKDDNTAETKRINFATVTRIDLLEFISRGTTANGSIKPVNGSVTNGNGVAHSA